MSALYERFKDFTMIPEATFDANIELASSVKVPGCVVECGVWKGGMIAAIAQTMGPERHYYLFDSFEGLPPAQEIDGFAAQEYQRNDLAPNYYDNCRIGSEYAYDAMTQAGVFFSVYHGWFKDTLPSFPLHTPIALLRLDGDWYESTMTCLTNLYDKVAPGGMIIIDDFFAWEGCSTATLDFFSLVKQPLNFDSSRGLCWAVK